MFFFIFFLYVDFTLLLQRMTELSDFQDEDFFVYSLRLLFYMIELISNAFCNCRKLPSLVKRKYLLEVVNSFNIYSVPKYSLRFSDNTPMFLSSSLLVFVICFHKFPSCRLLFSSVLVYSLLFQIFCYSKKIFFEFAEYPYQSECILILDLLYDYKICTDLYDIS